MSNSDLGKQSLSTFTSPTWLQTPPVNGYYYTEQFNRK